MEHPDIRFAMSYGYPHIVEDNPTCPECGEETDIYYTDEQGDILGCPEGIDAVGADEYFECPFCGAKLEAEDFVYCKEDIRKKKGEFESIIGCSRCINEVAAE